MKGYFTAARLAKLGIFAALSVILYFLEFPLPFLFPEFLKLNLSDLPVLICGFSMGPLAAFIVVAVKILIKLPFTHTLCVGELADFLIGISFVMPAAVSYKKNKSKGTAVKGMLYGAVLSVCVAMLANRVMLIPFYLKVMNWKLADIVNMCSALMPFMTEGNFYPVYIFVSVLPFNLLRCFVVGVVTYFVYKRISNLLKKFG